MRRERYLSNYPATPNRKIRGQIVKKRLIPTKRRSLKNIFNARTTTAYRINVRSGQIKRRIKQKNKFAQPRHSKNKQMRQQKTKYSRPLAKSTLRKKKLTTNCHYY